MDELNKRVLSIMEVKNLSRTAFASLLEISLPVLTHIGSGRNKPSLELIQKILTQIPEIDPDWLVLGKNSMFRKRAEPIDLSQEMSQLGDIRMGIHQIIENSKQVLDYHGILLKEINYLKELEPFLRDNQNRVNDFEDKLNLIESSIISKLKV